MTRIAFLGCDSTHTEAFCSRIHDRDGPFHDRARVVSIWGEDRAEAQAKASALGIDRVARTAPEALEGVDFVMVIGRFGEDHPAPTKEALARRLPTFVDKPFTVSSREAEELAGIARACGVPLTSSSPLRFASEVLACKDKLALECSNWSTVIVTVPASCADLGPDPRLDSAFFYGIHGIEVLLELVGPEIREVNVSYARSLITAHIELQAGKTVVFQLIRGIDEAYVVEVYGPGLDERFDINLDGSYYEGVLRYLLDDFLQGRNPVPLESTLRAISILEKIETGDGMKAP